MPVVQRGVIGRSVWRITADAAGQRFFAPLITNTTPSDITLEINPGTAAAVRCNCVVPRGAVRAHNGYYRLYANSTVAAYNAAHPYTGPHSDRDDFTTTLRDFQFAYASAKSVTPRTALNALERSPQRRLRHFERTCCRGEASAVRWKR